MRGEVDAWVFISRQRDRHGRRSWSCPRVVSTASGWWLSSRLRTARSPLWKPIPLSCHQRLRRSHQKCFPARSGCPRHPRPPSPVSSTPSTTKCSARALEWLIDRYRVKTDKASGIVNDPNDWCDEDDDPTYIVELIKKVTTVSVRTVELVGQLAA